MSQTMTLRAEPRTALGTRASKRLRAEGRIPAMFEAEGERPHLDVSIEEHEFLAARRAHAHLFDVELDGGVETAVVQHIQWDPIRGEMLHVEFRRVRKDVVDEFEVPILIFGTPKGGVASLLHAEVLVRTLPSLIPDSIEIDVSAATQGSVITAGDVTLPEGVEWAMPPSTELVAISAAEGEIVVTPEGEERTEVEIIGEKKDREEEKKDE